MKTLAKLLVLLALAAAGGWYWFSPRAAVEELRAAAAEGDTQALEQRIELASVRDHLKTDLRVYLAERVEDRPLAALGLAIGGALVDGLIDTFVSPDGLALLAKGRVPRERAEPASRSREDADYSIDREGLNRFVVRFEDEAAEERPALEFARRGLDWKLVRILLPGVPRDADTGER